MKKLCSLLLALAMCASLAACGGGSDNGGASSQPSSGSTSGGPTDAQLATLKDAYNQVATVYNDAVNKAQENGWTADEATMTDLNTLGTVLDPVGQALSGNMDLIAGADYDDLAAAVLEQLPGAQTVLERVSQPYNGGGATVVTDEALKPLANAYNDLVPIFNEVYEAAEANGWLADEQTSAELDAVYGMITFVGSGLSDDPSKLDSVEDMDGLVAQLQQFVPALEEIKERVSAPYEG